ncbi:hypothetical protein A1O7_00412 [Cladophialophora yegresii CBS 114405]|uniref:Methyltransferase small domain-containing protein n=1 Tax=Cladophialophora yegresii CBS 114405 TaxID=1182544 RepID=W9WHI1_9EURO|nr:uncharacterized protein A1O7_00412 [Cladophialophora yegresii CBS 114405]EXJ64076.1 hypothetical protein A1O7_00412 [Cladophialophora yegresii CBS 114405]
MVLYPTPSTSHVPYDLVYESAEDSFLFLDTLSSATETKWLHSRFRDPVFTATSRGGTPLVLELGPGSGVIVAFLTANAGHIFGTDVLSLSVDVNPHAALATRTTVARAVVERQRPQGAPEQNATPTSQNANASASANPYLGSLLGDLTAPLRSGEVDVLVFNPPYVPTESVPSSVSVSGSASASASTSGPRSTAAAPTPSFEESSKLLELSYAGGLDGMEVTNRLLMQIPQVLSPRGVAYVLFCRGNRPDEVKRGIEAWEGGGAESPRWKWRADTVGWSGKTAGWEKLEIVRIWREWKQEGP